MGLEITNSNLYKAVFEEMIIYTTSVSSSNNCIMSAKKGATNNKLAKWVEECIRFRKPNSYVNWQVLIPSRICKSIELGGEKNCSNLASFYFNFRLR